MLVVDEEQMKRVGGVRVVVLMKRVAIGRTAGGVEQAVGIRCRQEWHRHKMSRRQLVGTTGQRVQADGDKEVLVEGARGLGGVGRTDSGGHRVEEASKGAMEGKGTSSGEMGVGQEHSARQGQGGTRQGV